jgi:CTP:molybdopterin cytidylyltransferase MocA
MTVTGLVLAAGGGTRFGGPKALLPYRGMLLVERAAATLRAAGVARPVVVLGAAAGQVRARAALGDARTVENPDWPTGMASSLRAGLAALAADAADAAVVLLVDMPGVTAAAIRRVTAGSGPHSLVMAGYGGRRGHPVVLGRDHWAGVAVAATGDAGARDYLRSRDVTVVDCADVADDHDIDVPADA